MTDIKLKKEIDDFISFFDPFFEKFYKGEVNRLNFSYPEQVIDIFNIQNFDVSEIYWGYDVHKNCDLFVWKFDIL